MHLYPFSFAESGGLTGGLGDAYFVRRTLLRGPRPMPKLTALNIGKITAPGRYADAERGLILQVSQGKTEVRRSWIVRFSFAGKRREMGVGAFPEVSLAQARNAAVDIQRWARAGVDSIDKRDAVKRELARKAASRLTFEDCAERYVDSNEVGWSNPKHRQQWRNTLATYAYPALGRTPVADIDVEDVLQVIEPIWRTKTETASRVRGRMEAVLGWAIVRGFRKGPNPAVWRGHLDRILPPKSRVNPVKHHAALDWKALPDFVADLQTKRAVSARALEFIVLTAARSAEARLATWREIDWERKLWVVPAARVKTRREHRVPLTARALEILAALLPQTADADALIFAGPGGKPLSDSVFRALFRRMKRENLTAHGFRSTFRDWAGEATEYPRELAEQALAHRAGDAVELAYRRGDALERRRTLMAAWEAYAMSGTKRNRAKARDVSKLSRSLAG